MVNLFRICFILSVLSVFCHAEDLTTLDGRVYHEVSLREVQPCWIKILYSGGIITIPTGSLPDDFISKHNIPIQSCKSFKDARACVLRVTLLEQLQKKRIEFVLSDGRKADSSMATKINPAYLTITFEGGPRSYLRSSLPAKLFNAIGYSEKAAQQYLAAEKHAAIEHERRWAIQKQQIAYNNAQRNRRRISSTQRKYRYVPRYGSSSSRYRNKYGSHRTWGNVQGYYRKDGTYVRPHRRKTK